MRDVTSDDAEFEAHGVVLVLDEALTIAHVSEHSLELLGSTPEDLVGAPLSAVLDERDVERLRGRLANGIPSVGWPRVFLAGSGEQMKVHAFDPGGGLIGLDVLSLPTEAPSVDAEAVERVAVWSERLLLCETTGDLLDTAATLSRELTGFDGAWVTRLDPAGHSVILAADTASGSSIVGRRVPVTDVPPSQPKVRGRLVPFVVASLEAPGVALHPAPVGLDLQGSSLLRPFPDYLAHLTGIGVRALASVPIVVGGQLWGRIASANSTPKRLTAATQAELQLIGAATGNHLAELVALDEARERVVLSRSSNGVIRSVATADDLVDGLLLDPAALRGVCQADAAIVTINGRVESIGDLDGPTCTQLLDVARQALRRADGPVASSTTLDGLTPVDAARAAGYLAVRLTASSDDLVVWSRGERRRRVTWLAHRPEGSPPPTSLEDGVTERVEEQHGHCEPWTEAQLQQAEDLREAIGEVLVVRYQQVQSLNEELVRSNEEYDAFAHAAAHDLKGPLRSIRLTSEMLFEDTRDRLTAAEAGDFETVLRLSDRMSKLLDDLLAYARVGRDDWHPQPVALPQVMREAVELVGDPARSAQIDVAPATYTMDPAALRQILFNLVANAVKYSPAPATVQVGVRSLAEVAARVPPPATLNAASPDLPVLTVSDRGIGIDPAHHERIFSLFRQLDPTVEGSGAGLAICRLICRRQGGDIWVSSAPGEGATFYVAATADGAAPAS